MMRALGCGGALASGLADWKLPVTSRCLNLLRSICELSGIGFECCASKPVQRNNTATAMTVPTISGRTIATSFSHLEYIQGYRELGKTWKNKMKIRFFSKKNTGQTGDT